MLDKDKVSGMLAFFLIKSTYCIDTTKLMKLLYLSDRESMRKTGLPISGDSYASLPNGPILSETLNLINRGRFPNFITNYGNVMMDTTSGAQYLQELSDFDTEILNYVWNVFGGMTRDEIVEYTHDPANIPEWKEPNGSSLPISLQTILKEVGMGNYLDLNNEQITIDRLFNKLHS